MNLQFDAYENTDKDTKKVYPSFVEMQTDLLDSLNSRVVIPLIQTKNVSKECPKNLGPNVSIDNKVYALLCHQITSIPISLLKKKPISIESQRLNIAAAIDFLVAGFVK